MDPDRTWDDLRSRIEELRLLGGLQGLLDWDQQTGMPAGASEGRGRQAALLAGLRHRRLTDPALGELLERLEARDDGGVRAATLRNLRREVGRALRTPESLVRALAQAQAAGFTAWMQAREQDDFAPFAPALERLIGLTRERIAALRTDEADAYDVLLDEFEPGTTVAWLEPTFRRLAAELATFIDAVEGRPGPRACGQRHPLEEQRRLNLELVRRLGYDLERGRLDEAEHPFTVDVGPGDIRITTHYHAGDLLNGLSSTVHEAGHAMYEQGIPPEWYDTGAGEPAGFGIHESQSRFWENFIGRSRPFFRFLARFARGRLARPLDPELLYGAANRVERSLVRVAADEATYNLHIVVRFDLERSLLSGELPLDDLPGAWADSYERVLGLRPRTPREGVLQDVHWSGAAFGYFPSYTIGNLYAAALGRAVLADLPDLWQQVERGDFGPVLGWLRDRVHRRGHLLDGPEVIRRAVGERDYVADLADHLWERHGALYGVSRR